MEQIVLYLAVLAALSGFGMGMFNLAGPFLKRHNITLSSLNLASLTGRLKRTTAEDDLDLDLDDLDDIATARDFADSSFAAADAALLARRRDVLEDGEEELDEELAGVLDQVAEEQYDDAQDESGEGEDEEDLEETDEGTVIYTVAAESDEEAEDEGLAEEDDELAEEDEDEEDDEDDGAEEEETPAEIQVAAAGGGEGDDMMSFFDEAADAGAGAVAPWREDLPEVSIDELLAEARAVSQQIRGKKSNAA